MINQIKTKLTGDKLYFLSFGLFLITSILSTSFYYQIFVGRPYMWLQILGVALLVGYEFVNGSFRDQDWKALVVCAVLVLISFRVSPASTQRQVVLMFAYIYCARRIPFAKIAHFTLNVSIALVCIIVLSGYFGIIDNIAAFKSGRVREYLGFRYALNLPGILLNMTALWIYLRKNRITILGAFGWGFVNWIVYYLTDSRISFVIAEALLVAALVMRFWPKLVEKIKPLWWLAVSSFGVCGAFSLIMTVVYDHSLPWMRRLNSMLESRLRLGHRSLVEHGVSWFGERIEWLGNGLDAFGNSTTGVYTYVDCLYIKILQRYGIIFTVVLAALMCWSMYKLYKRREYHILLISATVAVHCVLDDLSFALHYNTFWIAMGLVLICPTMLNWNGKTTQISMPEEPVSE
jgi:hypothetical protein